MTPVKKALEEVESEKNPDEQTVKKKNNFKGQVTQLEATFRLDKVKTKLSFDFLLKYF
jgi:hypothetical protein